VRGTGIEPTSALISLQVIAGRFLDVVASAMRTKSNFYDENGVMATIEAMS
jgi:hypothetical protein